MRETKMQKWKEGQERERQGDGRRQRGRVVDPVPIVYIFLYKMCGLLSI